MKLFIFFGFSGTGKTYVGTVVQKYFGYHVYEGDNDLTPQLHEAFKKQTVVTDAMRDVFFTRLIQSVKELQQEFDKVIITQTFIKEKYREQFLKVFPKAKFILIETDTQVRETRLSLRKTYPLDREYARKMTLLFEKPLIKHDIIHNTPEGEEKVKEQLKRILL